MNKAVLVINTPENCGQCPCYDTLFEMCRYKYKDVIVAKTRPDWCPLKPLPEEDNREHLLEWSRGYQGGWNDCINAICGGEQYERSK